MSSAKALCNRCKGSTERLMAAASPFYTCSNEQCFHYMPIRKEPPMTSAQEVVARLRDCARAYPDDVFLPLTDEDRAREPVLIMRAFAQMCRHFSSLFTQAADLIDTLAARVTELEGENEQLRQPPSQRSYTTMNAAQLERAARRLCKLRGVDPEMRVAHGADPDHNGHIPCVLLYSPMWTRLAREVREHWELTEALRDD